MNKKTGEFSAADLKKPVGRKEPVGTRRGDGITGLRVGDGGLFVCMDCGHSKPFAEVGREYPTNKKRCKTCEANAAALNDPSWRSPYNGGTIESVRRSHRKTAAKTYKSGRLPKWMLT
jgi:hypothetical protein